MNSIALKLFLLLGFLTSTVGASPNAVPVSIIHLVANPAANTGKLIGMTGVLKTTSGKGVMLYASRESSLVMPYKEAIGLVISGKTIPDDELKRLDSKYVIVEGVFEIEANPRELFHCGYLHVTRLVENQVASQLLQRK